MLSSDEMRFILSGLTLLAVHVGASPFEQSTDTESGLVCEVLKHPREYLGQTFTFTGTFFYGVHGTYFLPQEKCSGDVGIRAVDSVPPPIHGRVSALVTAKGKLILHRQTPEPSIGKPAEVVAFSIARVIKAVTSRSPSK
jgi:hypothetical protein